MSVAEAVQTTSKASSSSSSGFVPRRKCACGGSAGFTGECEECRRRKFLGTVLHRTLASNERNDESEREADRVAEQVMRIAEPARTSRGAESPASSVVQGRVSGAGSGEVDAAPTVVQEVLASPGQPPDASARAFLEPRFGQSLDDVRLHIDSRAQRAAKSVHARAFTVGRHIVFGGGEYVPHSITSTRLLAHELTHVIQQTGGASVLARKSSAASDQDEGPVAVVEQVTGDEVEFAGVSSRGQLSRLSAARPDQRREEGGEAVLVEARPFPQAAPAGLNEASATRETLAEAAVAPSAPTLAEGVGIGTPSETGRRFNALPPSVQAETYTQLGTELSASFANQALETQAAIPELSASLDGVTELPATPVVATPPAKPSVAGQAFASTPEPVVKVPQAPALPPVSHPTLPTAQATELQALDQALSAVDQAPAINTTLKIPDIPLEGKADPAALGTLESAATGEAARSLDAAQAGVMDVSPEIVQPLELDEIVAVPALTGVPLQERTPQVEGMDKLAGYTLSPRDRAIVDAQVGPSMQEAATGVQLELDQHEQAFDQERTRLHVEADSEAEAAQARAEEDQRSEVEQGRQDLAAEQERTLAQQQAAVDGAIGELAMSGDASRRKIDDRLAADRATVDEVYSAAEVDVQAEVEKGHARADAVKGATAEKANAESWWDWAIDTWQGFVQWFAANLVAIWEDVNQIVAGLFDRAIQLATEVVNGAVAFAKQAISAYYDLWLSLADKLLGSIFPELAAALRTAVEGLKAKIFEALDAVAAGYLQTLRVVADALVAGLDAGVQAYKTGVAAYLALWEAIQQGQWDRVGRTVLTAILTAAGIDPEEFFATFSKFDEVVDDVIADPGLVGRNAVKALGLGFQQFGTNFIGNFTAAFVEWITGTAAIKLPKTFSLAGIFDVVCQVLNLTKAYVEKKAIQHLGQGAVTAIKELTEQAWAFVSDGWAGLWNLVKDKLTTLVDDVVVATGTWLVEKAILVVGRWIVGLAATMGISVIFEALVALWQFVMWLKDQFQRFWMIVKSTVDSVHDFVKGKIEPAADKIEGTLQDLIVPAIDLVAKLLNISNIAKKVEHIVEAVRGLIDRAIDGVIDRLKKAVRFGRKDQKGKEREPTFDGTLGETIEFSAGGEKHALWLRGSGHGFTVMVASDPPRTLDEQGKQFRARADGSRDEPAVDDLVEMASKKAKAVASRAANAAGVADGETLSDIDQDVEKGERELVGDVAQLFDLSSADAQATVRRETVSWVISFLRDSVEIAEGPIKPRTLVTALDDWEKKLQLSDEGALLLVSEKSRGALNAIRDIKRGELLAGQRALNETERSDLVDRVKVIAEALDALRHPDGLPTDSESKMKQQTELLDLRSDTRFLLVTAFEPFRLADRSEAKFVTDRDGERITLTRTSERSWTTKEYTEALRARLLEMYPHDANARYWQLWGEGDLNRRAVSDINGISRGRDFYRIAEILGEKKWVLVDPWYEEVLLAEGSSELSPAVRAIGISNAIQLLRAMATGETFDTENGPIRPTEFEGIYAHTPSRQRIADALRRVVPEQHEWLPVSQFLAVANLAWGNESKSTEATEKAAEAVTIVLLAKTLRSPTYALVFKQTEFSGMIEGKKVMYGHSGAVYLDGSPLTVGQPAFHQSLEDCLKKLAPATADAVVATLKGIALKWIWEGQGEPPSKNDVHEYHPRMEFRNENNRRDNLLKRIASQGEYYKSVEDIFTTGLREAEELAKE